MSNQLPDPTDQETEPLLYRALATAAVTAIVDALVAFGVPVTPAQAAAIIGVINVAAIVVLAVRVRRIVFSPATVASILAAAKSTPPARTPGAVE